MHELAAKRVVVVGLKRSGIAAARLAAHHGAAVTATDMARPELLADTAAALSAEGIDCILGEHPRRIFTAADLVIVSPGVPHTIAPLVAARAAGVPVIGEIEFGFRYLSAPVVAVAGTNGKTTVTELVGRMLAASGRQVFVGGNIGNPLTAFIDGEGSAQVAVLEVSSFQLDTIDTFRPAVAVLLNITEDHLDRYPDMAAYAASKCRVFENQRSTDTAVINVDDARIRAMAPGIAARVLPYSASGRLPSAAVGGRIDGETIDITPGPGNPRLVFTDADHRLSGAHNRENIAAAALAAFSAGGTVSGIQTALADFTGLSHRLERVTEHDGILFVDDSKATNVDAVYRALTAFDRPVVLIMGGRDKGGDFGVLIPELRRRVRRLVLLGEAADMLGDRFAAAVACERAQTMADAVARANQAAEAGDVVLLSPGCASFDMFDSYAHRGEVFTQLVKSLKG